MTTHRLFALLFALALLVGATLVPDAAAASAGGWSASTTSLQPAVPTVPAVVEIAQAAPPRAPTRSERVPPDPLGRITAGRAHVLLSASEHERRGHGAARARTNVPATYCNPPPSHA